ncbi:oxytocin-neurophysin 1-like [Diadema antillarum]|uniref:oxytocin-neurophysin 1-like n=1 Tax=Diadema antillarum TaxID=105358 RepID=UPI003A891659
MMSVKNVATCLLLVLVIAVWIGGSFACFVSNCPRGGKRSSSRPLRQCLECGPGGVGRCVGPGICCGPTIGCHINTQHTLSCMRENEIPTPCDLRGSPCQTVASGTCVAMGVCCNSDSCSEDASCLLVDEGQSISRVGDLSREESASTRKDLRVKLLDLLLNMQDQ